jgi:zinc protease
VTSVEGIDEYRLANGLQVLLVPDDSKPTTTVNLTYRVGSRHENYGETGMAHLLEHLLFKGSKKHPQAWAEFDKRGLRANGSTWFDRTNYTASFAQDEANLRWYLGWLADSMVTSFIARKDLDSEMTVVRNEMEAGENRPDGMLFQRILGAMYDWHNYGNSSIGARSDVENIDIPRLRAFYRTYYQPDNATLIVSGRFDPASTLAAIAREFGPIPKPKRALPSLYTLDPAQDGERSVTLRRVGGTPMAFVGYHMPAGPHPDFAAAELLTSILGDSPSGRLHKRLTEKHLAAGTFGYTKALHDPGFIVFGAQLAPGQELEKARAELVTTLESVAAEPIADAEVERARAKWLKDWEQAFTNPEAIGLSLSESIAQGDWRLFFLLRDRVRSVAPADVQRVARERLVPAGRTLGLYIPTEKPLRAPAPERVDLAAVFKDYKPQAAAGKVETFEATLPNLEARTQRLRVAGIDAALLPKGTRGGAVRAVLTLRFGDEKSLAGQTEAANFVAAMLDKGTRALNREQIQDRLDALKTSLSVDPAPGRVTLVLSSRREHLPAAIGLVGELLREPAFPADALDELKRQTLAALAQQREDPEALADNAVARWGDPYPRGDPRHARSFDEVEQDVRAIDAEALRAFHARHYGIGRAQFAAVGDLDPVAVRAALESAFGAWKPSSPFTRIPEPLVPLEPRRIEIRTPDKQNATLRARLPVPINDRDSDYAPLMLANYLLGQGGNSRLWVRIREKGGLSYDVRIVLDWNPFEPNTEWMGSAIFAPQNVAKVEAAFKEELQRALRDGFTAQEVAEGRQALLKLRQLRRAQDAAVAGDLANQRYLERDFSAAAAVDAALAKATPAQVIAALRKFLAPEKIVWVFAGDFK